MPAGYRVYMHTHHIEIAIRPLSDWPDDQVLLVYRLLAADVREILADPEHDPQRLATRAAMPSASRHAPPTRHLRVGRRPPKNKGRINGRFPRYLRG